MQKKGIRPRISHISPQGCGVRDELTVQPKTAPPPRLSNRPLIRFRSRRSTDESEVIGVGDDITPEEDLSLGPTLYSEGNNNTWNPGNNVYLAVGGVSAKIAWPWMAAIFVGSMKKQLCGGVLIDDKHVLTAAHCFVGRSRKPGDYTVMVGKISLNDDYNKLHVVAMKIHEDYNPRYYYNDIAVLRLAEPITGATPVCLPQEIELEAGVNCTLLGWGDLTYGGASSLTLQEVEGLPVVPYDECDKKYKKADGRTFPQGITDKFLCAGLDEGGKDACQGDSGGPLLYQDPVTSTWNTVGVVSFGYGCAEAGFPGVYTKVASFSKWIENYIDGQNGVASRSSKLEVTSRRGRWRPHDKITFPNS